MKLTKKMLRDKEEKELSSLQNKIRFKDLTRRQMIRYIYLSKKYVNTYTKKRG